MFQCLPDDPKIMKMDDMVKNWMFYSWVEDRTEESLLLRNQGCLIGSFWNPKAAQEILGIGNSKRISVSDENFDKAFDIVQKGPLQKEMPKNKRKRKKLSFKNRK